MDEFCKICGKSIGVEVNDVVECSYLGTVCRGCFLPFAKHLLENVDKLKALVEAIEKTPEFKVSSGEA